MRDGTAGEQAIADAVRGLGYQQHATSSLEIAEGVIGAMEFMASRASGTEPRSAFLNAERRMAEFSETSRVIYEERVRARVKRQRDADLSDPKNDVTRLRTFYRATDEELIEFHRIEGPVAPKEDPDFPTRGQP
jgi:hypothetical protein